MANDKEFEIGIEETKEEKVVEIPQAPEKRPWVEWDVNGTTYKLKLTSEAITKLEGKYKKNLLLLVTEDGLPPLVVMLTIVQAAMQKYHHGINSYKMQELFDSYLDTGKTQMDFLKEIILPLMSTSGFFTPGQMEIMQSEMGDVDSDL